MYGNVLYNVSSVSTSKIRMVLHKKNLCIEYMAINFLMPYNNILRLNVFFSLGL